MNLSIKILGNQSLEIIFINMENFQWSESQSVDNVEKRLTRKIFSIEQLGKQILELSLKLLY